MNKRQGEKLYTVQFSTSSDESDEFVYPKATQNSPTKPVILIRQNTRLLPKEKPNYGGLIEISDSYYDYSDNDMPKSINNSGSPIQTIESKEKNENNISSDIEDDQKSEAKIIRNKNSNNEDRNIYQENSLYEIESENLPISDSDRLTKSDQNSNQTQESDDSQLNQFNSPFKQPRPVFLPQQIEPQSQEYLQTKKTEFPIYLIKRDKKTHLNGRRLFFSLYSGEQQVYVAKCKSQKAHHVYITKGNEVHIKSGADAVMLVGNDGTDFSLRMKEDLGDEIMTIRILPPKTSTDATRRMNVTFFNAYQGSPKKIFSKIPSLNPDGKVEHDFQGRFSIESIKNAVLVSKLDGPNMLYIRKTGNNEIEIEPRFHHNDLWIFAIGIASFLSKVKGNK